MIINGFGGSSSSASVGNASSFLASADSLGVQLTLLKATSGVGAMLADICLMEGCATASTSGLTTLMGLNTYEAVLANSTAFNIINKSAYIFQRVYLNDDAYAMWLDVLPDTYTFPTNTFTKVADTDSYYLYSTTTSNTASMSVPSNGLLYVTESDGTSGTGSFMVAARFTVNYRWPRGYKYAKNSVQYSYMYNGANFITYMSNKIPTAGKNPSSNLDGVIVSPNNRATANTSSSSTSANPLTNNTNIQLNVSSSSSYPMLNSFVIGADNLITIGKSSSAGGNRNYTLTSIILTKTV